MRHERHRQGRVRMTVSQKGKETHERSSRGKGLRVSREETVRC